MSAWIEEEEGQDQREIEATFEDNFVSEENKEFQKLDDSDQYLQILGKFSLINIVLWF